MTRFISYIDENGKKRLKKSDEWLKKESEENKKRKELKKLLDKKNCHNHWLIEWSDKRKLEKLNRYIENLRLTIPKERWDEKLTRRFFDKVEILGNEECWNWEAAKGAMGRYGNFRYEGKIEGSHRIAYILIFGEIPCEQQVLHKCDNGLCVNPNHLFLGNHLDNMKDKANKNRVYRPIGEENPNHVLTWKLVNEIRDTYKNDIRITLKELANKYDMYETVVCQIINNNMWKDENYEIPFHISGKSGSGNGRAKLTWELVNEIREKSETESVNKLSRDYNVCWRSIKNIIENKTWII